MVPAANVWTGGSSAPAIGNRKDRTRNIAERGRFVNSSRRFSLRGGRRWRLLVPVATRHFGQTCNSGGPLRTMNPARPLPDLADRLLRLPLCADRVPGRAEFQRLPPGHRLGRLFPPLVRDAGPRFAADRRRPAVAADRRRSPPRWRWSWARWRARRSPASAAFRGRAAFEAAIAAPLVHAGGASPACRCCCCSWRWNRRSAGRRGAGQATITLAHASVSVAYVAVVVRARLADQPAPIWRRRRWTCMRRPGRCSC